MNIHKDKALRVCLADTGIAGELAISFFKTFTSPKVEPSVEEEIITIRINKSALGEVFMPLHELITKNPKEFGFSEVPK